MTPAAGPVNETLPEGLVDTETRPLRADALKNRLRILEAAEEVFAAEGVNAPVDTVAERAGLGVGTLYRNFPTKEALFEAIVVMRIEELAQAIESVAGAEDPGKAFFDFLRLLAGRAALKRDLFTALATAGIDIKSQCADTYDRMQREIGRLLGRAQQAGAVREDIDGAEAIGLVVGTCLAAEQSPGFAGSPERMLEIVIDGMRPRSSS
ncbi:MAG TPA: TetR/AcrR family transcriptional regulator [Acidimicrobiales bacterium]|nr:TetR/AcrR family transcriptional regulator [Acidimicrobiales bacterium]